MSLEKLSRMLFQVTKAIIAGIMGVLVVLIFTQVVLRYLFASSLLWIEELGRFMFVWLMFLGISVGVYQGKHIAITFMIEILPKWGAKLFTLLSTLLVAVFFTCLAYKGWEFALFNIAGESSVLFIPLGYVYFIMPISSALCVLYTINSILRIIAGKTRVEEA